jgi:hypothetical protein
LLTGFPPAAARTHKISAARLPELYRRAVTQQLAFLEIEPERAKIDLHRTLNVGMNSAAF